MGEDKKEKAKRLREELKDRVETRRSQHIVLAGEGEKQICEKCGQNLALVTAPDKCPVYGLYSEVCKRDVR